MGSVPRRLTMISTGDGDHHLVHKMAKLNTKLGYKLQFVGWNRQNKKKPPEIDGMEFKYLQHGWGYSNLSLLIAIPIWFLRLCFYCLFFLSSDLIYVSDLDSSFAVSLIAPLTKS